MTITKGTEVRITTTGKTDRIDQVVSDRRGDLYRAAAADKWFDDRYLEARTT